MKEDVREGMRRQRLVQAEVRDGVRRPPPPRGYRASSASAGYSGPGFGGRGVSDGNGVLAVGQGATSRADDVEKAIVDSN